QLEEVEAHPAVLLGQVGSPQPGFDHLGLDLLAELDTQVAGPLPLLLVQFAGSAAPPQELLVGQDLGVDEIGGASPHVVDSGVEAGNRRHVDRHGGLLADVSGGGGTGGPAAIMAQVTRATSWLCPTGGD